MFTRLIGRLTMMRIANDFLLQTKLLHSSSVRFLEFREQDSRPRASWTKKGEKKKQDAKQQEKKSIVKQGFVFDELPPECRTKEAFETALGLFMQKNVNLRGHCEFIYAALKRMEEFGVHEDLAVYKKLVDLFPKKKMVSVNIYQAEFYFYPKQQFCCQTVLRQMQHYSVYPDKEFYKMVIGTFGEWSHVSRKMKRLMYWLPKFKNLNPFPYPKPLPSSEIELAKLAMKQMCRDPGNSIKVFFTEALEEAPEDTWIVSGQSPVQKDHINTHSTNEPLYVDGPFRVWIGNKNLQYFMLSAEPNKKKYFDEFKPTFEQYTEEEWADWKSKYNAEFPESRRQLMLMPTIHEQSDGTILSLAVSGTSSKESMTCWINFLQRENPKLSEIAIVFRIRHVAGEVVPVEDVTRFKCTSNMVETTPV